MVEDVLSEVLSLDLGELVGKTFEGFYRISTKEIPSSEEW